MKKDPNLTHWIHTLSTLLPHLVEVLAVLLAIGAVGYILTVAVSSLFNRRHLIHQKVTYLELTPPASNDRTALANKALVDVWHSLGDSRSWKEKILMQKLSLTPEIVSSRGEGIRYIMRVPAVVAGTIEQQINAHSANLLVKRVADPLPKSLDNKKTRIIRFKQTGDWAFPFDTQELLIQLDPISYMTNALTKLAPGEIMAEQLVITPVKLKRASIISNKALRNEDLLAYLSSHKSFGMKQVFHVLNVIIFGILDLIGEITHSSSGSNHSASSAQRNAHDQLQVAKHQKPARTLSVFEQKVVESVQNKVTQPLFSVSMRAIIITDNQAESKARAQAIKASFAPFTVPQYQSLKAQQQLPVNWLKKRHHENFRKRLPELFSRKGMILSASEIAALYHFPNASSTHAENLVTSLSRTLPAPLSLKNGTSFGVLLGMNHHQGSDTPIGLTDAERQKHAYIIGGTGNGKTTMMEYAIVQDIRSGKGVALIDPHGDSAQKLLGYIPPERIDDVIYLNPKDIDHPIGLNLLELPKGLGDSELLLEKERVTEAVISVLRKVFADDTANAHRIESILRNAIHTAFTIEDATLFTILKLLRNSDYRKEVVSKLKDEYLKDFWREEFGAAGNMQRVSMSKGVTNRIDRFQNSPIAGRMLGQVKSTISFEDIINSGKILLCNFSQGGIGEDTSALFGTTILAMLKVAAERREDIPEAERRPFYLYVDEFQNFATAPFIKMLSSSRKYKLYLTIAEQSTAQQEEQRLTEAILANVSTVVCFRTGSPIDEQLLLPRFEPFIKKGDIGNLSAYNFYIRIQAKDSLEPLSGETIVLSKKESSHEVAEAVIEASQKNYAIEYKEPPKAKKTETTKKQPTQSSKNDSKKTSDKSQVNKTSGGTRKAVGRKNKRRKIRNRL
jgi:hypothetical protein